MLSLQLRQRAENASRYLHVDPQLACVVSKFNARIVLGVGVDVQSLYGKGP